MRLHAFHSGRTIRRIHRSIVPALASPEMKSPSQVPSGFTSAPVRQVFPRICRPAGRFSGKIRSLRLWNAEGPPEEHIAIARARPFEHEKIQAATPFAPPCVVFPPRGDDRLGV